MKKQTKIIIGIIVAIFLVIIAIYGIVMYYKTHPVENPNIITESYLLTLTQRYENGEILYTTEFEKYDVISTETEQGLTTTYYVYNDNYDVEIISMGKKILSISIVNRATYTRCDILNEDMMEFIEQE